MNRRATLTLVLLAGMSCVAGCPGSTTGRTDPNSSAAELAGIWCLTGDEQGFVGLFDLDEDGDPITLSDNPLVRSALGEDQLLLDGVPHTTDNGMEYTAIASASADGGVVQIFVDIRVSTFGFVSGALALKFEGELTTPDRMDGVAVILQDFPGQDVPDLSVQTASATKGGCE